MSKLSKYFSNLGVIDSIVPLTIGSFIPPFANNCLYGYNPPNLQNAKYFSIVLSKLSNDSVKNSKATTWAIV